MRFVGSDGRLLSGERHVFRIQEHHMRCLGVHDTIGRGFGISFANVVVERLLQIGNGFINTLARLFRQG